MAAASAALTGMTALAGMAAEKGGEGLQNALASGIGQLFMGSLAGGPRVS
jgi:hypothetical protein